MKGKPVTVAEIEASNREIEKLAMQAGRDAFNGDVSRRDNPYTLPITERAWLSGWDAAYGCWVKAYCAKGF